MIKYHFYVCNKEAKPYLEHIAFRDYLRDTRMRGTNIGSIKEELAERYRYDVDAYCEHKTEFVQSILAKAKK